MQAPNWTDFLQCSICTNKFDQLEVIPISLSCGHTTCTKCLTKLKTRVCPYDKAPIRSDAETLPPNAALLQLVGQQWTPTPEENPEVAKLSSSEKNLYDKVLNTMGQLAVFLQPLAEHGITAAITHLTKPMLKKLVTVLNCQVLESEGRVRAVRAARSIADRTVTELLVMHQNQQQISTLLWTAVRNRGCQFLGPVMQEEALKLILRVLESGNSLSRKNIVLFVVRRLSSDFPQASKTSVGHVVQLLYRASCFNVEKRDDDSSLMQLKEEFRSYECLRREHDGQIIRMAMEAGLRISPEQWSTLLYGDHKHKSDMQSIIDKLIAQGAASSGLSELVVAIGRSQDPYQLSDKVVPHLEKILKLQISSDKSGMEWEVFDKVLEALLATVQGFSSYMQIQTGRFKTGMCPHLSRPGGCPKGDRCTYAHTEEERDKFRSLVKPRTTKPRSGDQFPRSNSTGRNISGSRNNGRQHDMTPQSSIGSQELISSAPNSLPYSDYGSYRQHSGEQLRHSGPITAPVIANREWQPHVLQRSVVTADHTYRAAENGLAPYLSADQVYQKSTTYAPISQQIDLIRMQHEAVKQRVEDVSRYHSSQQEMIPPGYQYSQGEWLLPEGQGSVPSLYPQPTSELFSASHEDLLSSGSTQDGSMVVHAPANNSSEQQILTGKMEQLNISSSIHSNIPANYPQILTPAAQSLAVEMSAPSPVISTATTTTTSSANSGGDMEAEILQLREQLRKKEETIRQQQAQLQSKTMAPASTASLVSSVGVSLESSGRTAALVGSLANHQQQQQQTVRHLSGEQTQVYTSGLVLGEESSPQHSGVVSAQPAAAAAAAAAALHQLSPQQIQAALAAITSGTYYSSPAPAPHAYTYPQPHPWTGSAGGCYPTANTVSPASNYIAAAAPPPLPPQIMLPSVVRQTPPDQPNTDDMLAAYIQMMEQNKASGGPGAYPTQPAQPAPYYRH